MRKFLLSLIALVGIGLSVSYATNYSLTQGSGTTFGSIVVGGVNYAQQFICDLTTPGQCAAVSAAGAVKIDGSAVTQPVSGTVTANAGTNLNTSALATSANQATNGATTAHTCSTGGFSELGCLGQIDDDIKGPIPAGTNNIGFVTITPGTSGGWTKWSTPKNNSNTALLSPVVAVKSSAAGTFGGYFISNPNATAACMQVFDVATAGGVTLGTTRPDMVFCVPATSGANIEFANGAAMANGIQVSATTTASGSTAPSTGLDVTVLYK